MYCSLISVLHIFNTYCDFSKQLSTWFLHNSHEYNYFAAIFCASSLSGCNKHRIPGNMASFFSVESMGPHGQRTAVIYFKERATPKKYPRLPGRSISHVPIKKSILCWKFSNRWSWNVPLVASRYSFQNAIMRSVLLLVQIVDQAIAKIWKTKPIYFRGHQLEDIFVRSMAV